MASFPRDHAPSNVTALQGLRGEVSTTQGGPRQRRAIANRGWRWEERWPILIAGTPTVENLLATIRSNALREAEVTLKHVTTPGSGKAPNGTGTAGVTVSGADQTGSSLVTTGWPASTTGVVRAGDVLKIAGFDHVHMVTADADSGGGGGATISIAPSIFPGEEPATGAAITTTDVEFTAMIDDYTMPDVPPGDFMAGLVVRFVELPKATV